MLKNLLYLVIGFILLVKSADYLVSGASNIARKFNIPQIIIGLTIVSIGTSMPELIVSLTSALKGHSDMAIGNVVGSNISNLFLILGICASIRPLKFKDETVRLEIPLVIFLTSLLYILGNNGSFKVITKEEGLILVIFCFLFIIHNIFMARKNMKNKIEEEKYSGNISSFKSLVYIFY